MAQVIIETNDQRIFSPYSWLRIVLIGAALGVITLGLSWLIGTYIVDPLLCRTETLAACAQSDMMASNIASVVTATIGVWLLIRLLVRRAVLVAVAVVIALWNLSALFVGLGWFEVAASVAVIYALAYLLFATIFRIRSIFVAVIVSIIAILLVRWVAFL